LQTKKLSRLVVVDVVVVVVVEKRENKDVLRDIFFSDLLSLNTLSFQSRTKGSPRKEEKPFFC
jgi:hypothetical protein